MYLITVFKQGKQVNSFQIEASNALSAIERVETKYSARQMNLGDKVVIWTGYEFQARKIS